MARLPVPEFRRNQDQFLQYLYDDGAISFIHEIDPSTIADALGLDDGMKARVVDALLQDHYVAQAGYTGSLHLTPAGRRHVEQPTQGAPGGSTVVNFNGPNTGQISTGPNTTMSQTNNMLTSSCSGSSSTKPGSST